MLVMDGFYDGKQIQVLGNIPVKSKKRVIIAFLEDDYCDDVTTNTSIDPIKALRGCARNTGLTEKLLQSRAEDLKKEDAKWIK